MYIDSICRRRHYNILKHLVIVIVKPSGIPILLPFFLATEIIFSDLYDFQFKHEIFIFLSNYNNKKKEKKKKKAENVKKFF